MADSDSLLEVLREIRDELRAVRMGLGDRGAPTAESGMRTAVVERGARWRIAATAGVGAMALVALVLALRAGGQSAPVVVETAPRVTAATTATAMTTPPVSVPAPTALPAPAPTTMPPAPLATKTAAPAPKPAATRQPAAPAPASAPAVAAVPKRQVKPAVAPDLPTAVASDEDEALAFSPPPRRVRVHKMSYGPVDSEPAKL